MGLDRAPIEFQTFYFSHVLVVPPNVWCLSSHFSSNENFDFANSEKNWIRWEWAQRPYQVGSPNLDFGQSPICCHFSRLGRSFILNFNLTHHYISISARNLFKIRKEAISD